jgi:aminopeptidase N
MTLAINNRYRPILIDKFHSIDTYSPPSTPKDGIEERMLKNLLLELIARDDSRESAQMVLDHLNKAISATDKVAGLTILNRTSSPKRHEIMEEYYNKWKDHLSGYANYLRTVSSGTNDDVFDMIEREKNRTSFDITQPTWSRALFLPMAVNNKMVWTDQGIDWVVNTVVELAEVNEYTAGRLLNVFQRAKKLRPGLREKAIQALESIVEQTQKEISPSLHGQARSYLEI